MIRFFIKKLYLLIFFFVTIVTGDDNCWTLSLRYNVLMDSILEWNPQINSQCTNMYNGKSYCVFKEGATTFETPCIQTHKSNIISI